MLNTKYKSTYSDTVRMTPRRQRASRVLTGKSNATLTEFVDDAATLIEVVSADIELFRAVTAQIARCKL